MPAGRYRHRLSVERPVTERSGIDVASGWELVAHRWARVETLNGTEFWRAQQVESNATLRVTLREEVDGLNPKHRFLYGDRTLNIEQVLPDMEHDPRVGQTCLCRENV